MAPQSSIRDTFFEECEDLLEALSEGLAAMAGGARDTETVNAVFRAVHSVKGGAGAFGLEDLIRFAHVFETVMDDIRSGKMALTDEVAKVLLRAVAKVINQLPNRVSISGHTSVNMNGAKADNDWQLSASRADNSRKVLQGAGVDPDRVYQVSGKANSEPLYPDDPTLPGNRRIAIVLLREAPVLPPNPGL
mgnify:CR=1 FL=1